MILRKKISPSLSILLQVILICIIAYNSTSAQHLGYKRYTTDDGLSQSEVVSIFQDSRGFLWVGTKFGVSRFDGNKFITRFDSLGVLKSAVRFIGEFPDGSVFTSSFSGYGIFKPNGQMTAFKYPDYNSTSTILSWTNKGRIYVLFDHNPEIIIIEATLTGPVNVTGSFTKLVAALKRFEIRNLCFDKKYDCFYITDMNQSTYSFFHDTVIKLNIPPCFQYTSGQDGYIYMLSTINRENIKDLPGSVNNDFRSITSIGLDHGLFKLKRNQVEKVCEMRSSKPNHLRFANIAESGKIIIPDTDDGTLHYFYQGKKAVAKLAFDGLASMCTDDEGTLWIGTANGLMHVFSENFINFSTEEGLFPNIQTVIADSEGKVWMGSYEHGLQYFENGKLYQKEIKSLSKSHFSMNFFPGGNLDHLGRVHFCITLFNVMLWDGLKMRVNNNWPLGSTYCFFDDTINRKYFYGSDLGLVEQMYGQEKFKSYPVFPGNSNASRIVSIIRATTGELLLGGFKGLLVYDGKDFRKPPNSQHSDIPGANAMVKDSKGNIWIGNGNGIYIYDSKIFRKIANDHFNDLVLSLRSIDSTKLLIGGIRGIGILDLVEFYKSGKVNIMYFDKNNGFIGGECQQNCFTQDREGNYWIGASNGVVKIDAASIPFSNPAPRVYLTSIFTNNKRLEWNLLSAADFDKGEIKLSHLDNNIRFEFTGICFSAPDHIKFSYILEGFDKQWSNPATDRNVTYTNLPPGSYTFKVRALNDSGVWSETIAEFKVIATATLWQRWYFQLFIVILLSVLIIIGVSHFLARRTRLMRERSDEERRIAELQFKTLRNQLAPHFIFNALNAIGSSIYQNNKEVSYDFLQRFATLIRSTLIHADKVYRSLNEEIEFVKNYLDLEKFRFENKFDYKITIEPGLNLDTPVPKMIIQTFAENAVKHGLVQKSGKGLLLIHLSTEADYLKITIEDNGIGRMEAMKFNTGSTGKGMEIINEFIALFNKFNEKKIQFNIMDVSGETGKISGTCVIIKLPVDFTYNSIITKP
jgi:ligand-binding sensor domain-containing protein